MPRRGPGEWAPPPRRYRADRQAGFKAETAKKARAWDRKRARSILDNKALDVRRAGRLAKSLSSKNSYPRNMASMRYVRKRRLIINSHLGWLVERTSGPMKFATLLPRGWLISADELEHVNPRKLLEQLRAALNRAGVGKAEGWAFLALDSEYIPHLDAHAFHLHVATKGAVAGVVSGLRKRKIFDWQPDAHGLAKRPVQVKTVPQGQEARAVNYLVKSFHGKRVYASEAGKLVRTGKKAAMPEPRHSEYLMWLSRWKIEDFVLSVHLYFSKDRLLISKKRVRL